MKSFVGKSSITIGAVLALSLSAFPQSETSASDEAARALLLGKPLAADSTIRIGTSLPVSGPNVVEYQRGFAHKAIVKKLNDAGGINGRKIELIEKDDAYQPKRTFENVKEMVEQEHVFALMNIVGTPAASAVMPLVEKTEIPFFGAITGANFVRLPIKKSVFTVRASFDDEAEALINNAVGQRGFKKIAIFYEDDALGKSGRSAVVAALKKRDLVPIAFGSHDRAQQSMATGIKEIMKAKPEAVVLWTVGQAATQFVKESAALGFKPAFYGPSPCSPQHMIKNAPKESEGALLVSGYPLETDTTIPIVKEFREAMAAAGYKESDMSGYSFEAYFNAAVLFEGIKRAGKNLSQDALIHALESMKNVDMGGMSVSFSPTDHQGMHKLYMIQIKNGQQVQLPANSQIL